MSREPPKDGPLLLPADPGRLFASDRHHLEPAIQRVLESGRYVLGKECEAFEAAFASFVGVAGSVGVSSGTDALELAEQILLKSVQEVRDQKGKNQATEGEFTKLPAPAAQEE